MYTGIIQGVGTVRKLVQKPGLSSFGIDIPAELLSGIARGASVSIDGVCLTVTDISGTVIGFDAMQETLQRSSLGSLREGSRVNVERSARSGDEIGGHVLSGHVDTMAEIIAIDTPPNNFIVTFKVEPRWFRFIYEKGYIALHGASLTLARVFKDKGEFQVFLIPETLRLTTFGEKKVGDRINVEIDRNTQVIVETVERVLEDMFPERKMKGSG